MVLSFTDSSGKNKLLKLKTFSAAPPVTIGRAKEATVTFDDNSCSRIHCAIRYWDDMFVVKDMKSRNGTYVNGTKISVAPLEPGDVLKIGDIELFAQAEEGSNTDVTIAP